MIKWLKNIFRRFLPPPMNTFTRAINKLLSRLDSIEKREKSNAKALEELSRKIDALSASTQAQLVGLRRLADEEIWASTFGDTIKGSAWLGEVPFSPGNWAMGYPELYALYRILDERKPQRILELGLGQSTKMISRYAAAHPGARHYVVEHDPSWIAFFRNSFPLPENTVIVQLDLAMSQFNEVESVRNYSGFRERFQDMVFDFICVDGPLGADMKDLARIDILKTLPGALSEDFVILVDDSERPGEAKMLRLMEQILRENGIPFKRGKYSGRKDCTVICAEHLGFLTSM